MFDDFDDNVWDEHQWEAHLNEIERRNTQLRRFIAPDSSNQMPRWLSILQENGNEMDAVDAFIEEELQFDDPFFGDNGEDFYDNLDDEEEDLFEDEDEWEDEDFFIDDYSDFNEGEEWKELSDEFSLSGFSSIEMLDIYNQSRELAADVLLWTETINPTYLQEGSCSDFVDNVLKIGAKIAGGYSFGFDREFMGGNIAYTKKALYCANDALTILQQELKGTSVISSLKYRQLHEQLFEIRNDIGIYIQDLRDEFNKGF